MAADSTTDTLTLEGTNVTITTDANNDKVKFAVADGSTSAKGVVQLTNSTSSTSTTTAATPNSVKTAYDLANTAKTAATNAQTAADSKVPTSRTINGKALTGNITLSASDVGAASSSHTHTIANVSGLQDALDKKSDFVGTQVGSQEAAFYCKICTITIPNSFSDMYLEFDLIGRTTSRFQNVKFIGYKANTTDIGYCQLLTSGHNGNYYEVKGYQYVSTSGNGDTLELWCKVPSWDTLNVLKKQFASNGNNESYTNWITWNISKHTALPTTSDTIKLINANSEAWSGNAATATKLGTSTVGSSSQPIYLNSGTATKVTAVGTDYGGTGATTVAGARTNLDVYSKSEVDTKTVVDSALSTSSTKPVQNKIVTTALNNATSAISANTSAISANTSSITTLRAAIDEIQEITSAEIQALFA